MIETVFNILKVSVAVAIGAVFLAAISGLVTLITNLVFHTVIGEVFALMSCCLPFNALGVFSALGNATIAILAFLVAKKIFDLTSWTVSSV